MPTEQPKELSVQVAPENTHKSIRWSSFDSAIADVDGTGIVTAKKSGTATITATAEAGGKSVEAVVTVLENTGINLNLYHTVNRQSC